MLWGSDELKMTERICRHTRRSLGSELIIKFNGDKSPELADIFIRKTII